MKMILTKARLNNNFLNFIAPYSFLLTAFVCLTFPRISILNTDPIVRLDDILILISITLLIFYKKFHIDESWKFFLPFIGASLISILFNIINSDNNLLRAIIYICRLIEYYLVFLIIFNLKTNHKKYILVAIKICISINLFVMLLQLCGAKFNLTFFNTNLSSIRPYGLFRWTYEAATYAGIALIYFIYTRNYFFATQSALIILISQSRAQLIAIGCIFIINLFRKFTIIRLISLMLILVTIVAIIFNRKIDNYVSIFFHNYNFFQMYTSFNSNNSKEFELLNYGSMTDYKMIFFHYIDHSWGLRFLHWINALNSVTGNYYELMFGRGPSYFGVALDGQVIRLLGETGILGVFTFSFYISKIYKNNTSVIKQILIFTLLSSLFIDIFYSYKIMVIFYSLLALESKVLDNKLQ